MVLVKVGFSALLLALVLRTISLDEVVHRLAMVRPGYVAFCLLLAIPTIALSALRWCWIADALLSFPAAVKYILIGAFYGAVFPSAVSGDVARGVALAVKLKEARRITLPASILVDRLLGLGSLFTISAAGFMLAIVRGDPQTASLAPWLRWGALASVLLAGLAFAPLAGGFDRLARAILGRIRLVAMDGLVARVIASVSAYSDRPALLARGIAASIGVHAFTIAGYVVAFRAFGLPATILEVTIYFSAMSFLLLLPISVSGVGVRDAFSVVFFRSINGTTEQAVAFSWLLLFLGLVVAAVGALVQLWEVFRTGGSGNRG